MNDDYIFVYGTLKRNTNGELHPLLTNHTEFIDEASYCGKLYKIDYYPGILPSDNPHDTVQGEVYRLLQADIALALLDRYEECGPEFPEPNEYLRKKQPVLLNNGRNVMAWVYLYNHAVQSPEQTRISEFRVL